MLKAVTTWTARLSVGRSLAINSVNWHVTTCTVTAGNAVDSVSLSTTPLAVNHILVITIIILTIGVLYRVAQNGTVFVRLNFIKY